MKHLQTLLNPNNQIGYGIISAKDAIEFPNLENINSSYVLHKTIFEEGVDPQSVKLFYGYDDVIIPESVMNRVMITLFNNFSTAHSR